jgi:hypothetical protein
MPVSARALATRSDARVRAKPAAGERAEARTQHAPEHGQLLERQRTIGNQAVQRLIRSGTQTPIARQRKPAPEALEADRQPNAERSEQQETAPGPPSPALALARFDTPFASAPDAFPARAAPNLTSASAAPKVQRAWYNFDIPFTDYQFDPSIEGVKTAAGVVRDTAAEALDWIVDQITELVASGMAWLREKANAIEALASSALDAVKGAFGNILSFVLQPLGFLGNALLNLDGQAISNAWNAFSRLLTTLANGFKTLTDKLLAPIGSLWAGINNFATSLLNRLSGLTQNAVFKRLPDALQSIAFGAINRLKNLWKSVNDGFNKVFGKLKAWIDGAIDTVFGFVRKVLSFAINTVIDGVVQFGKIILFLKDLFTNPRKYVEILAQKAVQGFGGVENLFAGFVAQHFGTPAPAASTGGGARTIHRQPAADAGERRRSASWGEIGSGVLEMMGKKWNEFKANPMAVVMTLLLDLVLPIVGNVKDIIHMFSEIKKIVTGPLSAGSLEELWTSLLKILDIPILIYHTWVGILMRTLTLPLIIASFIPHPVVKGIAAAVGYGLLAAFVQAELMNIAHKITLLKTGATVKNERDDAYNRVADSLIAMAMTAVIVLIMIALHFIASLMKGVYNFIRGKVFKAKPLPAEGRAPGEGKGSEGGEAKPGEGRAPREGIPSEDGKRRIRMDEEGKARVCSSPCDLIRRKYESVMTEEIEARIKAIEDNPKLTDADKEVALKPIEQELAELLKRKTAEPPTEETEPPAPPEALPDKVQAQIDKAGLPRSGETPFDPQIVKNKSGQLEIKKAEIQHGPKKGKVGFVDKQGRIWIRCRGHAGYPDHWDVQINGGKDYMNVGMDGNPPQKKL